MSSTVHRLTFHVSRERALDLDTDVWYASPIDAPIRSGVSGETLAELRSGAEAIKHFVLGVPEDAEVVVSYVFQVSGLPAQTA
ncbi:hypothetical protein Acor_80940 [Acrocarpospora corrugata]|uniref:DUF1902 domain-containing protein n=1 Tax=Acrocarpospora corrugata TaxID=35763 RepID=A0A5M3WAG2_9ACTN|nr:hypothetical protein [Acrocarpospora corrugata]GES06025.1 hypothetical protein Acor_80940 [Acrocarpospora corrugata]